MYMSGEIRGMTVLTVPDALQCSAYYCILYKSGKVQDDSYSVIN